MNSETAEPKIVDSQETLSFTEGLVALQIRFLLDGQAINPDEKSLPQVKKEEIKSFPERGYSPFDNTSTFDRADFWQKQQVETEEELTPDEKFNKQKEAWVRQVTGVFADENVKKVIGKFEKLAQTLGISLENFTPEEAEKIYQRYFSNENSPTDVKKFVSDVLSSHTQDNNLNYEALKVDLPYIQWFAGLFGEPSSQIVAQLIDAEAKLLTQTDTFINSANENNTINNPKPLETKLLAHVWEHGKIKPEKIKPAETKPAQPPTPPTDKEPGEKEKPAPTSPQPRTEDRFMSAYARPGEPRILPDSHLLDQLDTPEYIAAELKKKFPKKYKDIDVKVLEEEIRKEHEVTYKKLLEATSLTEENFNNLILNSIRKFEQFLTTKYGVKVPTFPAIKLFLIDGKTAEFFEAEKGTTAYVDVKKPVIFLHVPTMIKQLEEIKQETGLTQKTELIDRWINTSYFRNVLAHEYSHLISDVAFWYKVPYREGKIILTETEKKQAKVQMGRGGLTVVKPVDSEFRKFKHRGKLLDEAVTARLVLEWQKNSKLDNGILFYAKENKVLSALMKLLMKEQNITEDEAFAVFVRGYFTPNGFRELAEKLSGKYEDNKRNLKFRRKSFLRKIYTMMSIEESHKNRYAGTLDYIDKIQKNGIRDRLAVATYDTMIKIAERFLK